MRTSTPTSANPAVASRAVTARYLSSLRLQEVLALQGSPLLGAAFALRHAALEQTGALTLLMAANLCLVAHIFVVNDWSNLTADLSDPNKAGDVFTTRGVGLNEMGAVAAGLLILSLVLLSRLSPTALYIALAIAALSALYSLPPFTWKGRPLLNSLAHLVGGVLHFLLGYSLGSVIDRRGLVTASFFAVTFAAGHLTQEVRDHHSDLRNSIRTNAVVFGRGRAFVASVALFTLSQALLFLLALQGTLPRVLVTLVVLFPVQLGWSLQALGDGLTYASVCRLQQRYRKLYAVIGLAVVAALWLD
jgi:4-hydroxybenzoate polyprenyltransferase